MNAITAPSTKMIPNSTSATSPDDHRTTGDLAGYMELEGASKDADCEIVAVDGGVSSDRGCCNLFNPQPSAQAFSCGNCTEINGQPSGNDPAITQASAQPAQPLPAPRVPSGRRVSEVQS